MKVKYFNPPMDYMVAGVQGCYKNNNFYHPCSSSYHLPVQILWWPAPPIFLVHTQVVWPCFLIPYVAPEVIVTIICNIILDLIKNMYLCHHMNPHP